MASTRFDSEERQTIVEATQSCDEHDRREHNRKARGGLDYVTDALRFLLTLVAFAFLVALADGVRREGSESYANLAVFKPQVSVRRGTEKLPVKKAMSLQSRDAVTTAATGTATLAFPDGSAILVEPSTKFEVRLLDYNRGAKRDRSFLVRAGSVFGRVSKNFGKKGQTLICTPNAVAAARETGFSVRYDKSGDTTVVEVIHGVAVLRNAGGRIEIKTGRTGTAIGVNAPTLGVVTRTRVLTTQWTSLARLDPPQMPVEKFERDALTLLDPVLQLVALTPRGFSPGDNNVSRKAATRQALTRLQQALEAVPGDVPDELNPVTMTELGLDETERTRILEAFAGFSIDRYEKRGANSYRVVVRSRDATGTVFQLTETGVQEVGN